MGAPKRFRKKFDKPTMMWNKARIESEHRMRDKYGLKTLKEYWMAASELRRIRRNARAVLSGTATEKVGREMIARLAKLDVVKPDASIDDLLTIDVDKLLARRLQSVVFGKGMARSMKQSRQLITHGFISVGGKRVTSPGYAVRREEEGMISYYKPIKIEAQVAAKPEEKSKVEAAPAPAAA